MRILLLLLGFLFFSVVGLPLLSITVARLVVDDGIENFRGDPVAYEVARRAYVMAEAHRDNPMQRLIAPAARVVAVTRKPGHCPPSSGADFRPDAAVLREYTAQVRFHTFFGYPVEDVYIECGGDSAG